MNEKKYLIKWDVGFGEEHEVFEANSQEEADRMAYEQWREAAECEASHSAEVLTHSLAEEYGYEDEL